MLEAKYFRDYKHSYMILQCVKDADKSYQCKLLTSGRIGDILHCSLRYVNGMSYFYYDISSKTTLESLYKGRQMSFLQVRKLFGELYDIYCRLGDNFMEESGLVLLPEFIYYDFSHKRYIGLYYPYYEEDRPYEALMDFLLEHIDGQDEHLADCLYQIYERAEESGFSLWDALQILGEPEGQNEEPANAEKGQNGKQGELAVFENETAHKKEVISTDLSEVDSVLWEEKPSAKKKSAFYPFLMILSVLGILGTGCVYIFFALSEEEMMILFACSALMGICFLVGLTGIGRGGKKEAKTGEKKEGETFLLEEEAYVPPAQVISVEHVLSKDGDTRPVIPKKEAGEVFSDGQEEWGNTVFFDSAKLVERKLYALDKKNKKHIELTRFPYTVGKMPGCVDCVLTDDSISRIHVRFEKAGDVVQMTDMNSTNGTYKNGLRLQPQETVEIEPGDEIRLGNLRYSYR